MSVENDPVVIESPLSQTISRHGVTVQVEIYEDGKGKWILEVVDQQNTSHVWDDPFETDELALAEAIRALEEEPLEFSPQAADGAH
ncbi:hypothetical protein OOT46_28050 [Aquabacterium sp. A7-Y]|uniref:hypothetical protein n=1 Tax=Aquabacterium sp. A7-Y TaxID=1349605 RepID=UPI00223CE3FF|nr:hypothetical protein [Aquabacterium sp. A7-Y]MCW7541657.1 hypothetical protein [Aquabacterium sp. A7-Y]